MTLVRIVKTWAEPDLLRQTPGHSGRWDSVQFTLDPVERCDYLVVLNYLGARLTVEAPPRNVWCFAQEPPIPANGWYEAGLPSYGRLFIQNRRLKGPNSSLHAHGSLPWHVGKSYDDLRSSGLPTKTRDLAWITSDRAGQAGHRRRLRFLERLWASGVPFDLYGRGFNPIPDKWDALAPYRYAIAVENYSGPDYWTEKLADCFLAGAMPLYFGATNIAQYFPPESYVWIDINDRATPRQIEEIVRSDLAERRRGAIAEARRRVLEEHNLFPRLARLIAADQAANPVSHPQRLELPGLRDRGRYYRSTTPAQRFVHRAYRRLRRVVT